MTNKIPEPKALSPVDMPWARAVTDYIRKAQRDEASTKSQLSNLSKANASIFTAIEQQGDQIAQVATDAGVAPELGLGVPTEPTLTAGNGMVSVAWDGLYVNDPELTTQPDPHLIGFMVAEASTTLIIDPTVDGGDPFVQVGTPFRAGGTTFSAAEVGANAGDMVYVRLRPHKVDGTPGIESTAVGIIVNGVGVGDIDSIITDAIVQAQTDATNAGDLAQDAMTSANGKNTIYRQPDAPTGGAYLSGDTWFDTNDGNSIHIWNGSTWAPAPLDAGAIADGAVTSAKISQAVNDTIDNAMSTATGAQSTAGTALANAATAQSAANQAALDAAAATARLQAAIAQSTNVIENASFEDGLTGWNVTRYTVVEDSTAKHGRYVLENVKTGTTWDAASTAWTAVSEGQTWRQTSWWRVTEHDSMTGQVQHMLNLNGSSADANTLSRPVSALVEGEWVSIVTEYTVPAGVTRIRGKFQISNIALGTFQLDNVSLTDVTQELALQAEAEAAQLAAEAAQLAADNAQDTADAAALAATAAATAAGNAQTSADGKSTVWHQNNAPAGTLHKVGDTWFDTNDDNKIHRWNGSTWAPSVIGSSALSDNAITAAKLADDAVTAAKILNGAVGTDELSTAVKTSITTAQSTADNAASAASVADGKAVAAQSAANTAQSEAEAARALADALVAQAENRIIDSSFEMGGEGWSTSVDYTVVEEPEARDGTHVLELNSTDAWRLAYSDYTPSAVGRVWEAGIWIRRLAGGTGSMLLSMRTATLNDRAQTFIALSAMPLGEWVYLSTRWTATSDEPVRLKMQNNQNAVGVTLQFDLASLRDVTELAAAEEAAALADSKAVIAQNAADAAQLIADAAQLAAGAAQTAANNAQTAANNAQTTANGKNKIVRATADASAPGNYVAGDQWWKYSGSQVTGMWLHSGSAWVAQTLTDSVITNLNAGTITAGTLNADRIGAATITGTHIEGATITASNMVTGTITAASGIIADAAIGTAKIIDGAITTAKIQDAQITNAKIANLDAAKITTGVLDAARIAAGSITASKLLIGDTSNLILDGNFKEPLGMPWVVLGIQDNMVIGTNTTAKRSNTDLRSGPTAPLGGYHQAVYAMPLDVQPGEEYLIEAELRAVPGVHLMVGVIFMTSTYVGVPIEEGGEAIPFYIEGDGDGEFSVHSGTFVAPAGAACMQILLVAMGAVGQNQFGITGLYLRRKNGGSLIVDGSITADKMAANSITAANAAIADAAITDAKIANLDAGKITTGFLDANRIQAGSITTSKLLVADTENLFQSPYLLAGGEQPTGMSNTVPYTAESSPTGSRMFRTLARDHIAEPGYRVKAVQGESFAIEVIAKRLQGSSALGLKVAQYGSTGNSAPGGTNWWNASSPVAELVQDLGNGWGRYRAVSTVSNLATVAYVGLYFMVNEGQGGQPPLGTTQWAICDPILRRRATAELIVDGAIIADKIATNAVTADKINANAVTAGKINAGAVETAKLAANAVTVDKLDANAITAKHTITGATIRTAATGARTEMTNQGLRTLNAAGTELIRIGYGIGTGMEVRNPHTNTLVPLSDAAFGTVAVARSDAHTYNVSASETPASSGGPGYWGSWTRHTADTCTLEFTAVSDTYILEWSQHWGFNGKSAMDDATVYVRPVINGVPLVGTNTGPIASSTGPLNLQATRDAQDRNGEAPGTAAINVTAGSPVTIQLQFRTNAWGATNHVGSLSNRFIKATPVFN